MKTPLVILIAGPPAVGKTTLSQLISSHYGFAYISEDSIAQELFPREYQYIEAYPDKLKIVQDKLLDRISKYSDDKTGVVVDVINLGRRPLKRIQRDCGSRLILRVLFPAVEITIERDKGRTGWTSGVSAIKKFYRKYRELKPVIGEGCYIDNGNLTPQQTLELLIACLPNTIEG